jgi:hypothetical protein
MQLLAGVFSPALGAYESIASNVVGSGGASTLTFSSIAGTYKHLQLRIAAGNSASAYLSLVVNSDTGANYAFHRLSGDGATADSNNSTSRSDMILTGAGGMSTDANRRGAFIVDILDYANTNKYKTVRSLNGHDNNGSGSMNLSSNVWLNTAAITSLTLSSASDFRQYSSFALYGIKG